MKEQTHLVFRKVLKMAGSCVSVLSALLVVQCTCLSKIAPPTSLKYNHFSHFHTLILPDGKETKIHLLKDISKRYYFALEKDRSPSHFSVTVTPCDVPIEWTLLLHKARHMFPGKLHGDMDSLDSPKSQTMLRTVSTLFHYKGNSVETYEGKSFYYALFLLEFLSTERDTHITVYLTTDNIYANLFPELPPDPRIDVVGTSHSTVTLAWKNSPSVLHHKENIQYCLLVNEKHNYKSLCAAETAIRTSELKSPKSLALSISPYSTQLHQGVMWSVDELSIISRANNGEVRQICIGTRNNYMVTNLSPATQYYFDVFVVNLFTNASAAYTGTFIKTLQEPEPKITEIKDGKIIQLNLKGQKLNSFQYQAKNRMSQFIFHSCNGEVHVQIFKNRKMLVSERFAGLRYFTLIGKAMDLYLVQLRLSGRSPNSSVKVQVSSHFQKPMFPLFPESLKIKSFSKLRTCDSITIAWLGTQERSKYCVYRKEIKEDHIWHEMMNTDRCSGPETRKRSEKVLCKYFHDINLQRAVTTETIRGLQPGTPYLLDVYLIGSSDLPVRYHSKVVKTRKKC
ncbi:protein NDNF-like [Ambystoma mexicanum]|uniref:protein NDNF-like n=1 Tax=Ambystoma mexicanum TaxID=8296 RepID=UPI0037E82DA6